MNSCDNCAYFIRIKSMVNSVGICGYEDRRLDSIIKSCYSHKASKYKRPKKPHIRAIDTEREHPA